VGNLKEETALNTGLMWEENMKVVFEESAWEGMD
jgi:hypothetical protein